MHTCQIADLDHRSKVVTLEVSSSIKKKLSRHAHRLSVPRLQDTGSSILTAKPSGFGFKLRQQWEGTGGSEAPSTAFVGSDAAATGKAIAVPEWPLSKIRWDLTAGKGKSAQERRSGYQKTISDATNTSTEEWTWNQWNDLIRSAAVKHCGRAPKSKDFPCLPETRQQLIASQAALAASYSAALKAKHENQPNAKFMWKRHSQLKSSTRKFERRCKKELICQLCDEVDRAMKNHDTAAMYRHTRSLSIWTRNTHEMKTAECVTANQFRQHYITMAGEPNEETEDTLQHVPPNSTCTLDR